MSVSCLSVISLYIDRRSNIENGSFNRFRSLRTVLPLGSLVMTKPKNNEESRIVLRMRRLGRRGKETRDGRDRDHNRKRNWSTPEARRKCGEADRTD